MEVVKIEFTNQIVPVKQSKIKRNLEKILGNINKESNNSLIKHTLLLKKVQQSRKELSIIVVQIRKTIQERQAVNIGALTKPCEY